MSKVYDELLKASDWAMEQFTKEKKMEAELNGKSLAALADDLREWRDKKSVAQQALEEANAEIEKAEQAINEKMKADEIEKFGHAGFLFYPYVESHPSVDKEKESQFFEWLEEKHEDGIIKRAIHPQTLKGWWRTNSEQFAEELTEKGFLKVFEKIRIGMRRQ